MDMTWVTDRIAVGGGIWTDDNMQKVVAAGVTHIIDMQIEFDDTALAAPYGVAVLWNAIDDDFQPKGPEIFQRGVDFANEAWQDPESRLFVHCAAGVHRAPMMTLALLRSQGMELQDALDRISTLRPEADWPEVYVKSVEEWVKTAKLAASKR